MTIFNLIKRNRKYFAAKTQKGYDCKILIDSNSESLEIGEHNLIVDDISVRSKYGTDLIFKLKAPANDIKESGICTLVADYNTKLIEKCRELGGVWDESQKAWIFSKLVEQEVEELDLKYNSKKIPCELEFVEEWFAGQRPLTIFGIKIATATGRDSGAKQAEGISVLKGGFRSAGSMKNWGTEAVEGTVIRLYIPEALIDEEWLLFNGVKLRRLDTVETSHSDTKPAETMKRLYIAHDVPAIGEKIGEFTVTGIGKSFSKYVDEDFPSIYGEQFLGLEGEYVSMCYVYAEKQIQKAPIYN